MRIHTRLFFSGLLLFSTAIQLPAQLNPVSWTFDAVKLSDGEYDLLLTAEIENGWFVYSQHIEEGGPIPTSFVFNQGNHFDLSGDTHEEGEHRKEGHDELFDMEVIKYGKQVVFKQRIKSYSTDHPVEGYLEFMVCDDNRCLPPRKIEFKIDLPH